MSRQSRSRTIPGSIRRAVVEDRELKTRAFRFRSRRDVKPRSGKSSISPSPVVVPKSRFPFSVPEGPCENSPGFQPWEPGQFRLLVPEARLIPQLASISLAGLSAVPPGLLGQTKPRPRTKVLGYSHAIPPGSPVKSRYRRFQPSDSATPGLPRVNIQSRHPAIYTRSQGY